MINDTTISDFDVQSAQSRSKITDEEQEVRNYEALKARVASLEKKCKATSNERKELETRSVTLRE